MTKSEYEKLISYTTYTLKDRLKLYLKGSLFLVIGSIYLVIQAIGSGAISVFIIRLFTNNPIINLIGALVLFMLLTILNSHLYVLSMEAFSKKFWGDELC